MIWINARVRRLGSGRAAGVPRFARCAGVPARTIGPAKPATEKEGKTDGTGDRARRGRPENPCDDDIGFARHAESNGQKRCDGDPAGAFQVAFVKSLGKAPATDLGGRLVSQRIVAGTPEPVAPVGENDVESAPAGPIAKKAVIVAQLGIVRLGPDSGQMKGAVRPRVVLLRRRH